jgi:hypothetical protein
MNAAAIDQDLDRHSLDTGIPKQELKRMCLRAGLDQLQRGELKVRAKDSASMGEPFIAKVLDEIAA